MHRLSSARTDFLPIIHTFIKGNVFYHYFYSIISIYFVCVKIIPYLYTVSDKDVNNRVTGLM